MDRIDLSDLEKELPPILYRSHPRFRELIGLSPRTMANVDSAGTGPKERIRSGRLVGYPREAMIEFLRNRMVLERQEP